MKRAIAILMAFVMLFTSSLGGAEGVLQLPASLIEIGAEAFSGDSSMTVADVPYGTESISSRAFADSALTKIYIPDTVTNIASDAFSGTNTVICSPSNCEAHTFALNYGYQWEDCGTHYLQDILSSSSDILSDEFEWEDMEMAELELLSAEGITDPEELEFINGYNEIISELQPVLEEYNRDAREGIAAFGALSESISEVSFMADNENMSFAFGGNRIEINDIPQDDIKITETALGDDGQTLVLTTNKGTYYALIDDDTVHLSPTPVQYMSRSTRDIGREQSEFLLSKFEVTLIALEASYEASKKWANEKLDKVIEKAQQTVGGKERVEKFYAKYSKYIDKYKEPLKEAQDALEKVEEKLSRWKLLKRLIPGVNIPLQIAGMWNLIGNWKKANEIYDHNHPTENDLSVGARETSYRLNSTIHKLWRLYAIEACLTTFELGVSIAAVVGRNVAAMELGWLGFFLGLGVNLVEGAVFLNVKEIDASLHTTLSGKVYDAVTKLPLQYVSITCGGQQVWTDSTGAYTIYLLPSLNYITFKRDDYQDQTITVFLNSGDELQRDIEMNPAGGTVTGVIRDAEFNTPLANVTILCGDRMELSSHDGSYSISLPVGPQTITYLLDGYIEKTVTLTVEEHTRYVRDVWLENKPLEPTPNLPETPVSSFGYTISNGEVTIGYFIGEEENVVIPERIEGYPVTKIGQCAFSDDRMTSVTIPDSVTDIGPWAFQGSALSNVTIGKSVKDIGWGAFSQCWGLTSVTIPDSVTRIDELAFSNCINLTSVTIPDSVTRIEDKAFLDCRSLTSVTIPDSVTSIGEYVFSNCRSLTNVRLPYGIWSIYEGTFHNCYSLTSITIPDSVRVISARAFANCSNLTNVKISSRATSISSEAFLWCISLKSVTIPDKVMTIGESAFRSCCSLTNITIPDSVTRIGKQAFSSCTSLTSMTIGNSVTEIGERAFDDCSALVEVCVNNQYTADYFAENYPGIQVVRLDDLDADTEGV